MESQAMEIKAPADAAFLLIKTMVGMGHYNNFKTVVYIPAEVAQKLTAEKLASDWEWIEKYIGLDKVYLETHRNNIDVPAEHLRMIKGFLESKGVIVSGGITTTINDFEGAEGGKQRLFGTFCYTDPAMRKRIRMARRALSFMVFSFFTAEVRS